MWFKYKFKPLQRSNTTLATWMISIFKVPRTAWHHQVTNSKKFCHLTARVPLHWQCLIGKKSFEYYIIAKEIINKLDHGYCSLLIVSMETGYQLITKPSSNKIIWSMNASATKWAEKLFFSTNKGSKKWPSKTRFAAESIPGEFRTTLPENAYCLRYFI